MREIMQVPVLLAIQVLLLLDSWNVFVRLEF